MRTFLFADRALAVLGIASTARLYELGLTKVEIDQAMMYGTIRRVRRGWYASHHADEPASAGGALQVP